MKQPTDLDEQEIPSSYLPPQNAARPTFRPQIPISGIVPPPNGHGKPVGVIPEEDKPATTELTTTPMVMGSKPTNRKSNSFRETFFFF